MSRAQEPHRPFLSFGNPFRSLSPKGYQLSPKLLSLLKNFEQTLAGRITKLIPAVREDVLKLSWMQSAVKSLCDIHSDVISLTTALEMPVSGWEDKWIEVYLDNSVKLLDICNAFTSDISRLKQGHLFLRCALHNLEGDPPNQSRACSCLDSWKHQISSNNPRLDNCFSILESLVQMLDQPKVKNSAKGQVLMRAMYGFKVLTITICSFFAAVFSGSRKKLMHLQVSETYLWAAAFSTLQASINMEGRSLLVIKELRAVDSGVKKMSSFLTGEEAMEGEALQGLASELRMSSEKLSQGLHLLAEEVDGFFRVVISGRDALLSKLRGCGGDEAAGKKMAATR